MESVRKLQVAVWGSLPGQILLYGSLLTHIGLGLAKLLGLRTWRRPAWEWAQIILGLAIPWYLISHIVFTRVSDQLLGIDINYKSELALLWPDVWISQSFLLLVVWLHACVGLHFWLRLKSGYARIFPVLAGLAVFIPTLGIDRLDYRCPAPIRLLCKEAALVAPNRSGCRPNRNSPTARSSQPFTASRERPKRSPSV